MAYEKQEWKTGDIISEEKLNHIEDGIYKSSGFYNEYSQQTLQYRYIADWTENAALGYWSRIYYLQSPVQINAPVAVTFNGVEYDGLEIKYEGTTKQVPYVGADKIDFSFDWSQYPMHVQLPASNNEPVIVFAKHFPGVTDVIIKYTAIEKVITDEFKTSVSESLSDNVIVYHSGACGTGLFLNSEAKKVSGYPYRLTKDNLPDGLAYTKRISSYTDSGYVITDVTGSDQTLAKSGLPSALVYKDGSDNSVTLKDKDYKTLVLSKDSVPNLLVYKSGTSDSVTLQDKSGNTLRLASNSIPQNVVTSSNLETRLKPALFYESSSEGGLTFIDGDGKQLFSMDTSGIITYLAD